MITNIRENNLEQYVKRFTSNPERFANILTNNELKEYGVRNSDFWKKFIININELEKAESLTDGDLYKYLARIYFVSEGTNKKYLIEKLPNLYIQKDIGKIQVVAEQLKTKGVIVDINSAVLVDKEKQQYKFLKYTIKE